MPETPFEERVRTTLQEQADKQPFDARTVKPTARRARRRLERNSLIAGALAVIALAALIQVGGPFMDTSTPAGPSPTPPPNEFIAGPASTPTGFQVTYDPSNLTLQGMDLAVRASNFSIHFSPRNRGGICIAVSSVNPALVHMSGFVFQEVRACPGSVRVGSGFGIGQTVIIFGPPETASVEASSHGAAQDALVLDPPSPFIDRLSSELGRHLDLMVLVVNTSVDGGRVIARNAAGEVLSTLRLPATNIDSYCGVGEVVHWCPGHRS